MKDIREMNLDELKALEPEIKARKAELKETAKAEKAAANASVVDTVNEMIDNKSLQVGMDIVVTYQGDEVVGRIVGVLTAEKESITVESTAFKSTKAGEENTPKRRYIKKANFVRLA